MKKKKMGLWCGIGGALLIAGLIVAAVMLTGGSKSNMDSLDRGLEITKPGYIMLSAEKQNVTIVTPGEYILTGENKNSISVVVDAENVTLILQNAKIDTKKNPGIINLRDSSLTIGVAKNTTNTVFGGDGAEYNTPIYSKGEVAFNGEGGTLVLGTRQGGGWMIVTENDAGVKVLGGTVVGLDLEQQIVGAKYLTIGPEYSIKRGSAVVVSDEDGDILCQFNAEMDFRKIAINSYALEGEHYDLYVDGAKVSSEIVE